MTTNSPPAHDLLGLADDIVKRAKVRGATGVEVFAEHAVQTAVNIEHSDIKGASIDEHQAVGIRVLVGNQEGFAYANRLDGADLDEAIDDAIAIARATTGDTSNGLIEPQEQHAPAGLFDAEVASLPADDVVARAFDMLSRAITQDERVRADGSFSVTSMRSAVVSTTGVRSVGEEAIAVYGLHGMAVDGDEVGSFEHAYDASRTVSGIDTNKVADEFAQRVLRLLRPVDGKSHRGRVVFSADAFEDIFLDGILSAVDGDSVFKGRSRLAEKRGETIASAGLTIIDDGTLPGFYGSSAHDREGRAHQTNIIIENGVLRTFLYDGKSARRAGVTSTGNASGGARATPHIGTTNIIVSPGAVAEPDLLSLVGDGLFVGRFSGNVDGVSGDFSGVAKGSFLIEGGVISKPVKETLIAGNVFALLPRIVALGDVLHRNMGVCAPWVVIDDVDVTAGGD